MNLGYPVASALSVTVFSEAFFTPSLSEAANYLEDTPSFRRLVAASYLVSYACSLAALPLVCCLLPRTREDAQKWKKEMPRKAAFVVLALGVLVAGFLYSNIALLAALSVE